LGVTGNCEEGNGCWWRWLTVTFPNGAQTIWRRRRGRGFKKGVGDGRWKWEWQWEWQSGPVSRGGITLPAYFHSFVSTSTSADDCKVMECITGCSGYYMLWSPPIYLHFCVSAGSDGAWMCTLLVALLAYPSSIYAFIYLTFQLHIFAQKRVPNRKDNAMAMVMVMVIP